MVGKKNLSKGRHNFSLFSHFLTSAGKILCSVPSLRKKCDGIHAISHIMYLSDEGFIYLYIYIIFVQNTVYGFPNIRPFSAFLLNTALCILKVMLGLKKCSYNTNKKYNTHAKWKRERERDNPEEDHLFVL